MRIRKLIALSVALLCTGAAALGEEMIFIGQPDFAGVIDTNWSSFANWFTTDAQGNLVPAGHLPLESDTAVLTGIVNVDNMVRIMGLVLTTNTTVLNGSIALQTNLMQAGSSFTGSSLFLSSQMTVGGPGCGLTNVSLAVLPSAALSIGPQAPEAMADLALADGTVIQMGGQIVLGNRAELSAGAGAASEVEMEPGTVLSSTGAALVSGSAAAQLIIDNNGTICATNGTLAFQGGIDWQCSGGVEQFTAATNNALILFDSVLTVDAGVTCLFTGPGTNQLAAGASFAGTVLVGNNDSSLGFTPGNLQIQGAVGGGGTLEAVGGSNQGAAVIWTGGTLDLASLTIDESASLWIEGGCELGGGALNNSGFCALAGAALAIDAGASITNLAGGLFEVQTNAVFSGVPGLSVFVNAGTFQVNVSGAAQFGTNRPLAGPDFYNQGLVEVQAGQLNLMGGVSSGQFQTAPGTILWFWGGTHTLAPGAAFTGNGSVRLLHPASAANWLVEGDLTVPELEVGLHGTLSAASAGTGAIQIQSLLAHDNATFNLGVFVVGNGQFNDSTRFNASAISVSSNLTVGGTNCLLDGVSLAAQAGSALVLSPNVPGTAAKLTLSAGSQLSLSDGVQLSSQGAASCKLALCPGALWTSGGTVSVQGSPAAHLLLDNSGTISVQSGALQFADTVDWQCSGGSAAFEAATPAALIVFAGPYSVATNAVSLFTGAGTNRFLAGGTVAGALQVGGLAPLSQFFSAGNLDLAGSVGGGGTLHALGNPTQGSVVLWRGGPLNLASVTIDAGAALLLDEAAPPPGAAALTAKLVNGGAVLAGASPATLTIAGRNDYQQAPTGTLVVELGGQSPGTQYSQLSISGTATLAGSLKLSLADGFMPQPGDAFQVLTCAACTGTFSGISGPQPAGTLWVPRYTGTNVTLILASQVPVMPPSLTGGALRLAFNTTAGLTYMVQRTVALSPADWQTLATLEGSGAAQVFEDSAAQSQAFYRVLVQ